MQPGFEPAWALEPGTFTGMASQFLVGGKGRTERGRGSICFCGKLTSRHPAPCARTCGSHILTAKGFKPLVQILPNPPATLPRGPIPTQELLCKDAKGQGRGRTIPLLGGRSQRGNGTWRSASPGLRLGRQRRPHLSAPRAPPPDRRRSVRQSHKDNYREGPVRTR